MIRLLLVIVALTRATAASGDISLNFSFSAVTVDSQQMYSGLVIAISEHVKEDEALVSLIMDRIQQLSDAMYLTIGFQIKSATILLPYSWEGTDDWQNPKIPPVIRSFNKSIETADITVGDYDIPMGTQHILGCGSEALRINIDSDYIYETGAAEFVKRLEHEWFHKRYGVFEEKPLNDEDFPPDRQPLDIDKQKFYHTKDNMLRPSTCDINLEFEYERFCNLNDLDEYKWMTFNNAFLPLCGYKVTNPSSRVASLMSHYSESNVRNVCDDFNHNDESPTQHNRLCQKRSTRSVMMGHRDFKDRETLASSPSKINTSFKVEISRSPRTVAFVLDVSKSMDRESRLDIARQAIQSITENLLEDRSRVLVATFANTAQILVNLTSLNTPENRQSVIQKLSNIQTDHWTCIGCGLAKAYEAIPEYDRYSGVFMILLTDGKNNRNDSLLRDMFIKSRKESFFIDTILLSPEADQGLLRELTDEYDSVVHRSVSSSQDVSDTYTRIIANRYHEASRIVPIYSRQWNIGPGQNVTAHFWMEKALLSYADVTLYWSNNLLRDNLEYSIFFERRVLRSGSNNVMGFVTFNLTEVQGSSLDNPITCVFRNNGETSVNASIAVNSKKIIASSTRKKRDSNYDIEDDFEKCNSVGLHVRGETIITLTSASTMPEMSLHVVFGCSAQYRASQQTEVIVSLYYLNLNNQNSTIIDIPLYDSGAGADVIVNDGVYSAYFTQYQPGNGTYSVRAQIKGKNFMRYASIGFFTVYFEEGLTNISHLLPPAIITGLVVMAVAPDNVTVSFTAPGDDLDTGTAAEYKVYYGMTYGDLSLSQAVKTSPSSPGTTELITLPIGADNQTVWLSLTTIDKYGLESNISNVVSFRYIANGVHRPMPWFVWLVVGFASALSILILIILLMILFCSCIQKKGSRKHRRETDGEKVSENRDSTLSRFAFDSHLTSLAVQETMQGQNDIYATTGLRRLIKVGGSKLKKASGLSFRKSESQKGIDIIMPAVRNSTEFQNDLQNGEALTREMLTSGKVQGGESIQWNISNFEAEKKDDETSDLAVAADDPHTSNIQTNRDSEVIVTFDQNY